MEKIDGVELNYDILKKKLNEVEVANLINQLLSTILYMQECGVVHRDLKPENILVTKVAGSH